MHERGRNSAAPRATTNTPTSLFAARIEMPVVLRGGMLDDRPALVPAGLVQDPASARVPRRLGTMGWLTATAICAFSVYAVRDTMFAPLAQSDAPSSAWETKRSPGDTSPPLIAAPGATHLDLDEHEEIATGTTLDSDSQPDHVGPSSSATGTTGTTGTSSANTPASPAAGSSGADVTTSTADATTSSAPSTSTPDTLGGHGANSGNGKGGSGNGSASP